MAVSSGDNSWFNKFHSIFSGIRKCGALKKLTIKIMQYFITRDQVSFDTSIPFPPTQSALKKRHFRLILLVTYSTTGG